MKDHEYREGGRPEDLLHELGYETEDINYSAFARYSFAFVVFFAICIVASLVIAFFMFPTGLSGPLAVRDESPRSLPAPPVPLLQSNITARTDIMSLRQKESRELASTGTLDAAHGIYRIPVDEAIDIIAKRGLPKTAPGAVPQLGQPGATASANTAGSMPGGGPGGR